MIGYLTLSKDVAGCLSTWEGTGYPPSVVYTTPTTDTDYVAVSVPAEMAGATFNSATLSYSVGADSGTRTVGFVGGGTYSDARLLEALIGGDSFTLYFRFKATGGTGGRGAHSATCTWRSIRITVDYTPAASMTGSCAVGAAGSASFSAERASLAYGESALLSITVTPSVAISAITTEIRAGTLSEALTFADTRDVAAGTRVSVEHTMEISDDMYAEMADRVYAAQIRVSFTGANGTNYTSGWVAFENAGGKALKLLTARAAPAVSAVVWGESGTTHITDYGGLIAGRTVPTVSFTLTLDTAADADISCEGTTLSIDGKTYVLAGSAATLSVFTSSGTLTCEITALDSYGQTGTYSGTLTVLGYTPPTLTGLEISRYSASLSPGGQTVYELDDDGTDLWLDAQISCQTALGSGSNLWTLKITPDGGSAVTVAADQSLATKTYLHDRSVLTASYAATSDYGFEVELSDSFTVIKQRVTVPKAGGIFNIEKCGVSVGKRSGGTVAEPLFECAYPAHFLAGVYDANGRRLDQIHDTGWQALTLSSSCSQATGWAACAYRVKDGVCYVRGAVTLAAAMPSSATVSVTLTTLPDGARPSANMLANAGARSNYSSIEIDSDGSVLLWNRIGAALGTSEVISLSAVFPVD